MKPTGFDPEHGEVRPATLSAPRQAQGLVVMASSAGGVHALATVLASLPGDFPLPIAIVQHRPPHSVLAKVLQRSSALAVRDAQQGERLRPGSVYLAPPGLHMTIGKDCTIHLAPGPKVRHVAHSANPLFESAAEVLGPRVIAVVLTGMDSDGTDGVQSVKQHGGTVLAQDMSTAEYSGMPRSAIQTGCVDQVLPLEKIGLTLWRLAASLGERPPDA